MRLQRIDYVLLTMLAVSLLFALGKFILVQAPGWLSSAESAERRQAPEENVRVHVTGQQSDPLPTLPVEALVEGGMRSDANQEQESQAFLRSLTVRDNQQQAGASEPELINGSNNHGKAQERSAVRVASGLEPKHYRQVYSLEVGVYKTAKEVVAFSGRYPEAKLYCRKKDNGNWAGYYGVYDSYSEARSHLQDTALLERVGAYVVKLNNAIFTPCASLLQTQG